MNILIFGGTTEGRELSRLLREAGAAVTVSVATAYGGEEQGRVPGVQTRTGPMSEAEKAELLKNKELCVDATHPYAAHVSASVKAACESAGVEYLRLVRPPCDTGDAVIVGSAADAAAWLKAREGRVMLTTGSKNLGDYRELEPERLIPRVLPDREAIAACEALGIPHRNIIAMQGPFSRELNAALMRQYAVRFVVSKDGGGPGGFPEKREAAKECGARLIVICRPEERGLCFDEVLNLCIARLRDANMKE